MTRLMKVLLVLCILATLNFSVFPLYMWGMQPTLQELQNLPQWAVPAWLANGYAVVALIALLAWVERRNHLRKNRL